MRLLSIDPGPSASAYVLLANGAPTHFGKKDNDDMLSESFISMIRRENPERIVIEKIASFGMAVGSEVFETCFWTGRFVEAFGSWRCHRITRIEVKNNLCHSSRAKDANIRQAIIDRFGGKDKAIGKKASPGPLYGISADCWSALAVGLTWLDRNPSGILEE